MIYKPDQNIPDEAMLPVSDMFAEMINIDGFLQSNVDGVTGYLEAIEIELPVELDVITGDNGKVNIVSAPPLYHVETTLMPVFHQVRVRALITRKKEING